jgi:hypothetical protein
VSLLMKNWNMGMSTKKDIIINKKVPSQDGTFC